MDNIVFFDILDLNFWDNIYLNGRISFFYCRLSILDLHSVSTARVVQIHPRLKKYFHKYIYITLRMGLFIALLRTRKDTSFYNSARIFQWNIPAILISPNKSIFQAQDYPDRKKAARMISPLSFRL